MSFAIYLLGAVILIGGLSYAAVLLHVPPQWIAVAVAVMIGLAVLAAVTHTRQKDSAD
jgi:hypothetical protein